MITRVLAVTRLANSANGNPQWFLSLNHESDILFAMTAEDSMIGHKISDTYAGCLVDITTTTLDENTIEAAAVITEISYPFWRDTTPEQAEKILLLGGDPTDFRPAFDLPTGWLMGVARGITYGVAPNGDAHS